MPNTRILPVKLPSGTVVMMETETAGERDISTFEGVPEPLSLEMVEATIAGIGELVEGALNRIKPESIKVEFGIELSYEAGKLTSFIVQGSTKGSLKLALEWKPEKTPPKA